MIGAAVAGLAARRNELPSWTWVVVSMPAAFVVGWLVGCLGTGCVVYTHPRRPPPPPPVVVLGPPPPQGHVPPGQIRAAEVHERNAARKAAHEAEKAERKREKHHGHDRDDDDDDHDHGRRD